MKRKRGLSSGDAALWAKVVKSVKPFPGRAAPDIAAPPDAPAPDIPRHIPEPNQTSKSVSPGPLPLAEMDPRLRRHLLRGRLAPQARLDLHGMRQDEAHAALRRFIMQQHAQERQVVLVITGKGTGGEGILRRHVPHWLAAPDLRHAVIGFEEASARHGGAGALYVRLRRRRGPLS